MIATQLIPGDCEERSSRNKGVPIASREKKIATSKGGNKCKEQMKDVKIGLEFKHGCECSAKVF